MRWNRLLISIALAVASGSPTSAPAATFGTVVPVSGQASDIALDESRGKLYIANFTAGRIDVMSTSDKTIHTSINLLPNHPGALALSLDRPNPTYLLVANFQNGTSTPQGGDLITVINLNTNAQQTFAPGDSPLAAAFLLNGQALIMTASSFYLFNPATGTLQQLATITSLAQTLPAAEGSFPGQVVQAAMSVAADGVHVWGMGVALNGNSSNRTQIIFRFDASKLSSCPSCAFLVDIWTTSPSLLPRVSTAADGSWAMIGWSAYAPATCVPGPNFMIRSRYPNVVASNNVTGHAIDSINGILYAQIPDPTQPASSPSSGASATTAPTLSIMDSDNLAVRQKLYIPENLTGRGVLNAAATVLYSVSDSGVTVFPVGSLNQAHQLAASTEDLLVQSSFCTRSSQQQTFTISDPGGNKTDFNISALQAGVTVSPTSGVTPATITVTVNPSAVASTSGTLAVPLTITSLSAVNVTPTVRLLISSPDPDQRGAIVDVPGTLADVLPDPARNRYYVIRQDTNKILVFNGANNTQVGTLRTGTTPTHISLTADGKSLMVANANSQLLYMYDLNSLQPLSPIMLPASHYGHAIAQSNNATLALIQDDSATDCIGVTGPAPCAVDRINFVNACAYILPALGTFTNDGNQFPSTSVLAPAPSQGSILLAAPNGNVMLYDAQADTFVVSRQDLTTLSGGYAAADPPASPGDQGTYVVGNVVFNPSLVPVATLNSTGGNTLGFAFTGQGQAGYRVTGTTASAPGIIQNLPTPDYPATAVQPVPITEAPLLSTKDNPLVRTVAPLASAGTIVVLTTSGLTVLPSGYSAAVAPPTVSAVVSAADGSSPVAPGGLISIYGSNMAATNLATSTLPLPTAIAQSCLVVNGNLAPLIFVSPTQINAQLPAEVGAAATMTIHTPGGISNNFNFAVNGTAPSIFQSGSAGPLTGLATIVRADDGQLVTATNPLHGNDTIVIYLTGMGATSPAVADGMPAPTTSLASALTTPTVTLGGQPMSVYWAGLVPGSVGLYQINASAPLHPPQGLDIPLVIDQGTGSTTVNVRVVD